MPQPHAPFPPELITLAERIVQRAAQQGRHIASAESCTGGLVAAALTEIAGSSQVVAGGIVSYTNAVKQALLGVSAELLAQHGAVSEPVAIAMAEGALRVLDCDLAISTTGVAGPGPAEGTPEGRVCLALAVRGHTTQALTCEFGAPGRATVRQRAARQALQMLWQHLQQSG